MLCAVFAACFMNIKYCLIFHTQKTSTQITNISIKKSFVGELVRFHDFKSRTEINLASLLFRILSGLRKLENDLEACNIVNQLNMLLQNFIYAINSIEKSFSLT